MVGGSLQSGRRGANILRPSFVFSWSKALLLRLAGGFKPASQTLCRATLTAAVLHSAGHKDVSPSQPPASVFTRPRQAPQSHMICH